MSGEMKELVLQGTQAMLNNILQDLQGGQQEQSRALDALQSFTRGKASKGASGQDSVQSLFLQQGGLPLLVHVLDTAAGADSQSQAVMRKATKALAAIIRDDAGASKVELLSKRRQEALEAGCVQALCSSLSVRSDRHVYLETVRALHSFVSADTSGSAAIEVFASGGIQALVDLVDHILELEEDLQITTWMCEVLAVLNLLVGKSRTVARVLVHSMGGILAAMAGSSDALTLSLGLDILEETLTQADSSGAALAVTRQGGLLALVHCLSVRGMASKALGVLALLVRNEEVLPALRALIEPTHYGCICQALQEATSRGDLADRVCSYVLLALFGDRPTDGLAAVRGVVLSRSLTVILHNESLQAAFLAAATSPSGELLIANLGEFSRLEAAMAAAHLYALRGLKLSLQLLLRPQVVSLLIDAMLGETVSGAAEYEATSALVGLLRALDGVAVGTSTPLQDSASPSSDKVLPSISASRTSSRGSASLTGDEVGTVTFDVGGKPFYAPGWLLTRYSRQVRATLLKEPNPSAVIVSIPSVEGISDLFATFGLAVQCVQELATSRVAPDIAIEDALDLWTLAAELGMDEVRQACERVLLRPVAEEGWELGAVLERCPGRAAGTTLLGAAVAFIAAHLGALAPQQQFRQLVEAARHPILTGLSGLLSLKLTVALGQLPPDATTPSSTKSSMANGEGVGFGLEGGGQ